MWNNYFLQIRKKYSMRVSSKEPLIINFDGKDVTKNKDFNILEEYKGSFRYAICLAAKYFSNKYKCLCIYGGDEISFIFENPMDLINDINSDNNTFSTEIISVFSQYFFDYFNRFYDGEKIFFHGKCFSIHKDKIKSFIKYKSKLIEVLTTTYFLKKNNVHKAGNIKLNEKIDMCLKYPEYNKFINIQKGVMYYSGNQIDLESFLNDKISVINDKEDVIEFDESMFSDILGT